ncbi:MAG TPA: PIN domain-containing protein [Candidatus Limnocylindria bacterium]|nr:PIN domain-containing protein [Candidatus Limnocylindria bacterium]
MIFFDTSAALALIDQRDPNHHSASDVFRRHVDTSLFVTHNYVVLETVALLQRRLGIAAVRAFVERLLPLLAVRWVDAQQYERAMVDLLALRRRQVSLVDRVSFGLMRDSQIRTAFAFDRDFTREGFKLLD